MPGRMLIVNLCAHVRSFLITHVPRPGRTQWTDTVIDDMRCALNSKRTQIKVTHFVLCVCLSGVNMSGDPRQGVFGRRTWRQAHGGWAHSPHAARGYISLFTERPQLCDTVDSHTFSALDAAHRNGVDHLCTHAHTHTYALTPHPII